MVSPSGAVSKLSVPHLYVLSGFPTDGALSFGSARHLGENPNGKWTLRVTDHISASTRLAGTSGWSQAQVDRLKRKLAEPQYLVEWSITAYGHVGAPTLGAPGITGVTSGDGSLTVAWEAPDDTGGAAVTAYDLRYIRSDAPDKADAFWTVQEGVWASGALQYTLTGLTKGAEYEMQVRAVTANGGLPWSHAGVGTYRTVPGAPTIESLSAGDRSLVVSWSAPADNGGADNVRYDVSRTPFGYLSPVDGKPHWALKRDIWASGELEYTLSGLTNGREYGVRVRAVNAAGEGPWSTVARGIPSTIRDAPSIWRVVTPGDGSLTVQWYAPADSGGAAITGYDLRYIRSDSADKADAFWTVEERVWASGRLRYTLSGLTNGEEYDVQMRAVTADGDLSWSDTSVGTPGTAPSTPTIESLSSGGDRSVIVRWSPPADDGGHDITSYDLGWGRTDGYRTFVVEPRICWASRCRLPSGELEYTLSGLTNGTEYDVRVRAVNAAGGGPWSTTVRTATQQAPTAATVTEVTPGDGSLSVKWDAPADSGGAAVTGYDLRYIRSDAIDRRDELRTVEEGVWTSGELEFTLTGLGNGVRYDVQVRAVTADGDLPWSYTGVGTPRATPSAPTIESLSSGDSSLTVQWSAPAEKGGAAIIGYDLRYIRSDAADKADADWAVEQGVWASGELEYTLSGLTNGTEYDVQVRAVNAAGDGPWSATGTATPQGSAPTPTVTIELSPSGSVEEGTEIALTMSFSNLPSDPDVNDPDVNLFFRADVVDADQCENQDNGYGIGVTRYMDKVDEDPEIRDGTISAACPAGDYTIEVSVSSPDNVELASASANFSVVAPAPEPALSTDATLSSLTLSDVTLAFASTTTEYTASVANDVDETTVTPTTNHGGAAHAIKLDGVADADGVVPLAVGSNVITIEVTAEDGNASQTYTITVTRAAPPAPGPAVTVELSPSGPVEEGTEVTVTMSFANLESDSDTSDTDYIFRADVVNADGCEGGGMGLDRYMYKVDEDPEVRAGTISTSCAPGDYTVEVSISSPSNIELASATADFTVNTPAEQQQTQEPPLSTDATLSGLALSEVTLAFASSTTEYAASVANDVDETTVTPTTNDDGATYAIKLGGLTDADGVIPLAVGSNVITIEVTAEDGETTKTYTVTVTRAAPPLSADATLSGLTLSGIDIGAFDSSTTGYTASVANDVAETTVTPTLSDDGASYAIKLGGVADDDGTVSLAVGSNVITIEVTAEDGQTTKTYTVTVTRAAAPAPEPTVAIELSSDSVEEGTEITVTMSFANLTPDHDTNLVFRADVVGADGCEGQGIGVARNISKVDEDPEIRTGTIASACTAGDYTLEVSLSDDDVELASARADFAVVEPEPTDEPKPTSPPDVPDTPTGEVTGKGQVRLDWNDVEGATYYQVRFYDNEDWVELPTDEIEIVIDGSRATVSNLPVYGFYYFAVRAGNAAGVSEWSDFLTLPNPEQ